MLVHITVTMFAVFPKLNPAKEVKIFNLYSYWTLFHFTLSNYIANCFIWPSVALGLPDCKALSDSYLENNHCIGEEILSTNYPTQFKFSVTEETEISTALSFRVSESQPYKHIDIRYLFYNKHVNIVISHQLRMDRAQLGCIQLYDNIILIIFCSWSVAIVALRS